MIINQKNDDGLAEAWNRALFDLGFGSIEDWVSDGVTGVEIETKKESDVPTLAIYRDENETIDYPLVGDFREIYP